ncbi:MAG: hypothetical protein NDI62_00960 [Burkholderiales bacterium]|nr:hypothetical protein [Burkholderiales bacterium]
MGLPDVSYWTDEILEKLNNSKNFQEAFDASKELLESMPKNKRICMVCVSVDPGENRSLKLLKERVLLLQKYRRHNIFDTAPLHGVLLKLSEKWMKQQLRLVCEPALDVYYRLFNSGLVRVVYFHKDDDHTSIFLLKEKLKTISHLPQDFERELIFDENDALVSNN